MRMNIIILYQALKEVLVGDTTLEDKSRRFKSRNLLAILTASKCCTHRHRHVSLKGVSTYQLCSRRAVRSGPGTLAAARNRRAAEGQSRDVCVGWRGGVWVERERERKRKSKKESTKKMIEKGK